MTISIRRLSDDSTQKFPAITPESTVRTLKFMIKQLFPPANANRCVLVFNGDALQSDKLLSEYGIINGQIIIMDDVSDMSSNDDSESQNSDSDKDDE